MRYTRVEKFRRLRRERIKKIILYGMILPSTSILLGYIISALFILPNFSSTAKWNDFPAPDTIDKLSRGALGGFCMLSKKFLAYHLNFFSPHK